MFAIEIVVVVIIGYLMGSIPSGLLLTKASGLGDIRDIGSGNIGATNVLRTGNKKIAAATLLLDMAKGYVVVSAIYAYGGNDVLPIIGGIAAFVGHCFPVWLKFQGGKGVATFFGIVAAFSFPVALVNAITWIAVALISRYSSLASLIAVLLSPLYFYLFGHPNMLIASAFLAVLVYFRHIANIQRLMAGTETRIGSKAAPPPQS